jgi:catalase (peroxidase I)
MNLYAFQYPGKKGWFQIDRVTGLEGPIRDRFDQHGSAGVFKEDPAGRGGCAAGGADKRAQGQEKQNVGTMSASRMLWPGNHKWERSLAQVLGHRQAGP